MNILVYLNQPGLTQVDMWEVLKTATECRDSAWLAPTFQRICTRDEPLSAEEATVLGPDRFAAVCRVRERSAGPTLPACRLCKGCYSGLGICERRVDVLSEILKESSLGKFDA